ncbi:MAG TPA: DUF4252 domain-containing protein [Silvibacterium sp.]|nr:DUF4252 domain-containing protein [Silvibacterium sp.]
MKKQIIAALLALAMLPGAAAFAQTTQPPFPVTLEKQLAARASNYTEVTLDRKMLEFASHFMDKEDDAEGKRIISKLNGIYVRTYQFDKPDQYSADDLAAIRRQFETSDWTSLVKQRSKNAGDDSDIYIKLAGSETQGIFLLNAEPKQLNFIFISGPIDPEDISQLVGHFGIPSMKVTKDSESKGSK